jgi:hypothetical protein
MTYLNKNLIGVLIREVKVIHYFRTFWKSTFEKLLSYPGPADD